jgi:hypothetical protein
VTDRGARERRSVDLIFCSSSFRRCHTRAIGGEASIGSCAAGLTCHPSGKRHSGNFDERKFINGLEDPICLIWT